MKDATTSVLPGFNLFLLRGLLADMTEEQMHQRIGGVGHTPAWIVGHLALTQDFVLKLMGRSMLCPEAWLKFFGPGQPAMETPDLTKAELLAAVERGHAAVAEALPAVDLAGLTQAHNVAFLKGSPLKTVGEIVVHLMITHESFHLGQLSAWRRQAGFKPLL